MVGKMSPEAIFLTVAGVTLLGSVLAMFHLLTFRQIPRREK